MKVLSTDASGASIQFSADELRMLNNAMNETLEALDDNEFETRVGVERADLSALLDDVHEVIVSLPGE